MIIPITVYQTLTNETHYASYGPAGKAIILVLFAVCVVCLVAAVWCLVRAMRK